MRNTIYNVLCGAVNFCCAIICAVSQCCTTRLIFACATVLPIIVSIILNCKLEKQLKEITNKQKAVDNEFSLGYNSKGEIVSHAKIDCGPF